MTLLLHGTPTERRRVLWVHGGVPPGCGGGWGVTPRLFLDVGSSVKPSPWVGDRFVKATHSESKIVTTPGFRPGGSFSPPHDGAASLGEGVRGHANWDGSGAPRARHHPTIRRPRRSRRCGSRRPV